MQGIELKEFQLKCVNKLLIITIEINLEQCYNDINWYNLS